MKGIKKCLLLALSLAMSATLFVACGGGGGNDGGNDGGNTETSSNIGGNGSESDSDVKLPDISVEVPDVEDIDGAPVANADEWSTIFHNSLSATNATIVITASENGTVMESGITMIANGVVYDKWDNKDGTSSYNFFGEVDGQSYHWQSEDGKTWTYEEIDWTPADYATVAYELEDMDEMLTFAGSTWNAETGMYTGDCNIGAYSLKISDGKVVYIAISADSGMMAGVDCVYQIVYGQTAAIQLPALGGGKTEEEAAWDLAWENTNKATNLTANGSMTEVVDGKTSRETAVMMMADGKSYCYYSDEEGIYGYEYYGTVDGRNYCWSSEDNETWEVEELNVDIARFTTGYGIAHGMEQVIDFSQVTYENDYYSYVFNDMTLKIKIADGYIVEFGVIEDDGVTTFTMTYGNATVGELPPLPQIIGEEVKDATEWANALENSMAQNNFICTVKGRSERDGKVTVRTEYTAVDNGKVYMESETVIPNGNTAMGTKTRTYQGYVDGVAYEWIDMGYWDVREIDVVETSSPVEYVGLEDWDFAMAKFDQETGAYAFETDGQSLKVKVVDGLVAYIELNAGGFFSEFTITYGNANVVLPSLDGSGGSSGGNTDGPNNPVVKPDVEVKLPELIFDLNVGQGIVGEQVSAEIFKKAITEALDSTNFTIQGKSYIEGVSTLIAANIVDGKHYSTTKAAVPTEDGGYEESTMHMIASTVDGTDWAWMSFDGKYWDNGPAEDVVMGGWKDGKDIFGRYLQVFLSMDSQFNAQTGEYFISADGVTVAIKIVDGEVKTVYMSPAEGQYMLYVITYDNAIDFNLPPVTNGGSGGMGGDVVIPELKVPYGEEVNAEVWEKAIEKLCEATNFSMQATDTIATPDYSVTAAIMMQIADNKGYAVAYIQGRADYSYIGNVEGKNYEWYSMDGNYWECRCMGDAYAINGSYFLEEMVSVDLLTFETLSFDEKEGGYRCQINETDYVIIGINDGKVSFLKKFWIENQDGEIAEDTAVYVLSYGDAYVGELPPITNGGSGGSISGEMPSEKEWDYAFEKLLSTDNVSQKTVTEKQDIYGVSTWEHAEYRLDGNAIENRLERKTSDGSGDIRQRMVWAKEDGVDTLYIYSYETGVWTKAYSSAFSVEEIWETQTRTIKKLAGIYEQMSWDAQTGYFYLEKFAYVSVDGYKDPPIYDVRINIFNGQVIEISYRSEDSEYSMQTAVFFYDYDQTSVAIPVDGQGDIGGDVGGDVSGDMGNVTNPDVGVDKEENMDNNEQLNPTYPTNSDNGETDETDNGEEKYPENDKVIIINN